MGRGAHLVLDDRKNVFRMRITGSINACARRVAQREKIEMEQARQKVLKINGERTKFVKEMFNNFPSNKTYYDLVLNSDGLTSEQISEITLFTMKQMGFYVPERNNSS